MRPPADDGASGFDDAPTNVLHDQERDDRTPPGTPTTPDAAPVDESSPTAEWHVVRLVADENEAK